MTTTPITGLSGAVQLSLQGVSSGGGTGSATGVPPGILALPNGTLLRGNIVQVETSGFAVLRTPKGDLTLKSELPLKRGSEVILRLETLHGDLRAKIISVDGLTPKELGRLEPPLPPAASSAALTVEDVVDLPDQPLPGKVAGSAPLPPPVEDSVEIAPKTPVVIKAVLLSRAPELPTLLKQLPSTVFVSPQRLDSGAVITLSLLPQSIALPGQAPLPASPLSTPVQSALPAAPSPVMPAATLPQAIQMTQIMPVAQVIPTTPLPTTIPTQAAPAPALPAPTTAPLPTPIPPTATVTVPPAAPATAEIIAATPPAPPIVPTPAITTPLAATASAPTITTPNLAQTPTGPAAPSVISPAATTPVAPAAETPTPVAPVTTTRVTPTAAATPPAPATPSAPLPPMPTPTPTAATPIPQEPESPAAALTRGIVTAQVIGTEQSGETVLKTPLGMVKLDLFTPNGQRLTLPTETTLKLQLHALEPAETLLPNLPSASSSAPAAVSELARHWHSLPEMLSVLQQSHPQIAQELLQTTLPRPGPTFARDVFLFLIGMKSESPEEWLGKKTLESLEQSLRGDLVRKFSAEMGTLRQLYADAPAPGPHWQTAFIPVYYEGEWHQNRFFIKRDKPKTAQEAGEATGTRFIMEVDFSRLGPMQFDGFVKKIGPSTQFDLIIRSAAALAADHQNAIRAIFAEASELTGFKGGLSFQVGQPFPVLPLEEVLRSDRNVIA